MQNFTWPSVSVSATNPSVGINGTPSPSSSTLVAGQDPSGDQQPLQTDATGALLVSIDPSATPFDVNVTEVGGAAVTLGQKLMAASIPVVLASDETVPISAASLPLPAGAATSALQTSGNASLTSIDSKLTAPLSVTGPLTDTQLRASAVPVSVASLPLPAGAATEATLSALNAKVVTVNTGAVVVSSSALPTGAATEATLAAASAKLPATLGQKVSAASLAVVLASDQSSIPTQLVGKASKGFVRNDYSSVNVTTGAYVQLIASTSGAATEMFIFDSSGQTLKIAFGAAASEIDQFLVVPGGNGTIPIAVPAATRISIKAVSANATVGEIDLNLLG